jgi:hypothetical protein
MMIAAILKPMKHKTALLLTFALLASVFPLRAEISEPDNVLYGSIVIDDTIVTAARTDVVVEARRTPTGPAVARYRMGSNPALGDFYSLRIPVESVGLTTQPDASTVGQSLVIVLMDWEGQKGEANYDILDRGAALRVDFGIAVDDSDQNGLPDSWEIARFGGIGQNPNGDDDDDGQSNLNEWIAGTHPRDGEDVFRLDPNQEGGLARVSFVALRAEGPGYENKNRFYALESKADLAPGSWTGVNGFTNIIGDNQNVSHQSETTFATEFFRGKVWLEDR